MGYKCLLDRKLQLQAKRRATAASLNALLDRPANTQIYLPRQEHTVLPSVADADTLFAQAGANRPLLAEQRKLISAARSRLDLAKKDYLPDFKLGVAYGFRSGSNPDGRSRDDFASVLFSLNLPLYSGRKQDKAVEQRQSELIRAKNALGAAHTQTFADIEQSPAEYQRAREQVSLYRDGIIPQARQTVASMLAGYQVNQVDFLNLVRTQIMLYNYETDQWQALSEANRALARLAASVGLETL